MVDLSGYQQDIVFVVGISGGKDSTALMLYMLFESGIPQENIRVTFCDTGNEDTFTYRYIDMLSEIFPIERIVPVWPKTGEEITLYTLAKKKGRFPSTMARFCTQYLKIKPSQNYIRSLLSSGYNVISVNGVRKAEAHSNNNRGSVSVFEFDIDYACWIWRPILDWGLQDVWGIQKKYLDINRIISIIENDEMMSSENKDVLIGRMSKHGIPRNPLYDMGALRVGCFPCINSRKAEIRAMDKYRPERINIIDGWENSVTGNVVNQTVSFFHANTVPEQYRSKTITTSSGEEMKVPTIRDVVEWSKTAYGGKQFDFDPDIFSADDIGSACDIGGFCE